MVPDPPALLVKHQVVDDAADRQLGILLDRIVLQVFVAAVAVHQELPLRVALRMPRQSAKAIVADSTSSGL